MRALLIALFVALALAPQAVRAGGATPITADPSDNPLTITGWLPDQTTLTGNLRLMAQGADVPAMLVLPSDFVDENQMRIPRDQVRLVGDPNLTANVPKNFQVTVSGIPEPGTYKGQLEFLQTGQPRDSAYVVPVTVVARARPQLTLLPGTDRVQLKLVNCAAGLDCWMAGLLLPASAFLDSWQLQFDNPGVQAVTVTDIQGAILGQQTGYKLTDKQLGLPTGKQTLPARQIGTLPITLTRTALDPDHYTGSLYLTFDGKTDRLLVPMDLSVRSGPWLPFLVLLLGVVLGRLVKYMQERGGPQAAKLEGVNQLNASVQKLDPADRAILQPMLDEVRQNVYDQKLDVVQAALTAIEARMDALTQVRDIEEQLNQPPDNQAKQDARTDIGAIRQEIKNREDDKAQKALGDLKTKLDQMAKNKLMSNNQPDAALTQMAKDAGAAGDHLEAAKAAPLIQKVSPQVSWLKSSLIGLSGLSQEVRAEATLWVVAPLLYLVLLFGLLVLGMNTLYVSQGTTFGAQRLGDFMGLALWGLSSDVASRTLSNLGAQTAGHA